MKYRRLGNIDVSVISFDCGVASTLPPANFRALVQKAFDAGIDFFYAIHPDESAALGESLDALEARRRTYVAAGIPTFFAAYTTHLMSSAEFLEHELADRLERLKTNYIDCFVLDLGAGRSVDLESVLKETIPAHFHPRSMTTSSYEGGIFLHETLAECFQTLGRFKTEGRIRLIAISGENISYVRRILVKHAEVDAAFVPYNYAFRAAAQELIPIASETKTAVVATRPLWWGVREIPVTVLAESPFPPEAAGIPAKAAALVSAACKWPLTEPAVATVLVEPSSLAEVGETASAGDDGAWTRNDEETLRGIAAVASAQRGVFLVLSAMNSKDPTLRARGWAACLRMGLPDFGYDPSSSEDARTAALKQIAASEVQVKPAPPAEDLDELL